MRAAVLRGPGRGLRIESVPDPAPGPTEVVVKVRRSGVCGSDVSLTAKRESQTLLGPEFERAFDAGAILGHEVCGTVVELGRDIRGIRIGDSLAPMFFSGCTGCAHCRAGTPQYCAEMRFPMGGYAQYARVHPSFSVVVPPELTPTHGAWVEPLATSLHVAESGAVTPGDRVLVLGAGALGLGAVHFARTFGAASVVAVARTAAKADAARRMGADHLVVNQPDTLPAQVTDLLGGPPDVVLETAGAPGLVDLAITCVRPWGRVVVAGLCLWPELTSHAVAEYKNLTIRYTTAYTRRHFDVVTRELAEGSGPPVEALVEVIDPDNFPVAFEALRDGHGIAKLHLDPWAS